MNILSIFSPFIGTARWLAMHAIGPMLNVTLPLAACIVGRAVMAWPFGWWPLPCDLSVICWRAVSPPIDRCKSDLGSACRMLKTEHARRVPDRGPDLLTIFWMGRTEGPWSFSPSNRTHTAGGSPSNRISRSTWHTMSRLPGTFCMT